MVFAYLDLLREDVLAFFVFFGAVVSALLVGISFHEFSHALVADSLGDPTPRRAGRVSLNPLAHLDPAGTVLLFMVGFGWGKPVPVNGYALRNGVKAGMATVAGAGPVANFAVAGLAGLPLKFDAVPWHTPFDVNLLAPLAGFGADDYIGLYLTSVVIFSIILGVFNLIPLFPLDGHRVVPAFLTDAAARSYMRFQSRYGMAILIVLIALPFLTGGHFGILFEVMGPIINRLARLFAGIDTDVFG
ncbi:MAG: site-2 protease family protein [Chloroflexi bacterium]|nr:site-2 protease family protein [Chloroflexota bacterium]